MWGPQFNKLWSTQGPQNPISKPFKTSLVPVLNTAHPLWPCWMPLSFRLCFCLSLLCPSDTFNKRNSETKSLSFSFWQHLPSSRAKMRHQNSSSKPSRSLLPSNAHLTVVQMRQDSACPPVPWAILHLLVRRIGKKSTPRWRNHLDSFETELSNPAKFSFLLLLPQLANILVEAHNKNLTIKSENIEPKKDDSASKGTRHQAWV